MSTALALGAVTAVLRNVLDNGLIDSAVPVGSPVRVSAVAPDSIKLDDPTAPPQLNLFLYRVSQNPGWSNVGLPSTAGDGSRVANPPLALDLHYLLTAYGRADLQAEILLGYGMHLLHERPWLDRAAIRQGLQFTPVDGSLVPSAFREPAAAGLADQVEAVKITHESLDTEEMSRLWSAMQAHYRPTAAYAVSAILIEATKPTRSAPPVLSRGPVDPATNRDRGVVVVPSLIPPYPTIDAVEAAGGQPAARLGESVVLKGHDLDGTDVRVRFAHRLLAGPHEIALGTIAGGSDVVVPLPSGPAALANWPAGVWSVSETVVRPGEVVARESNAVAMLLAPRLVLPPVNVARDAGSGRVTIDVHVQPRVRPEQQAQLAAGATQVSAAPRAAPADPLRFTFDALPAGSHRVSVRVDGVESRLVDRSTTPPSFDPTQSVDVP